MINWGLVDAMRPGEPTCLCDVAKRKALERGRGFVACASLNRKARLCSRQVRDTCKDRTCFDEGKIRSPSDACE